MKVVILDNEAVQALADGHHPNRFAVNDHLLGSPGMNQAAAIVRRTGVSPVDAHVDVAALEQLGGNSVAVITKDDNDITRAADNRDVRVLHL